MFKNLPCFKNSGYQFIFSFSLIRRSLIFWILINQAETALSFAGKKGAQSVGKAHLQWGRHREWPREGRLRNGRHNIGWYPVPPASFFGKKHVRRGASHRWAENHHPAFPGICRGRQAILSKQRSPSNKLWAAGAPKVIMFWRWHTFRQRLMCDKYQCLAVKLQ